MILIAFVPHSEIFVCKRLQLQITTKMQLSKIPMESNPSAIPVTNDVND